MVVRFKDLGLQKPSIKMQSFLILDQATTELDTVTEKSLISSISGLKNKMTLITITHRLSTLEKCDQIIELKDGNFIPIKLKK